MYESHQVLSRQSLKHKTKIGLYWKFVEQLATYGMQFVVGIVMARLLSPEDFGISVLPTIFISLAQVFIDGSFGTALVRKPEVTDKDLSTAFYYSIGVGLFAYICLFFAAPYIANFYNVPILSPLVRTTALTFIWSPLSTPQVVLLQRRLNFKTPARISIINKIISAILGIIAAYCGMGIWALVIFNLSASIMTVLQNWMAVKWIPREKFSKESFLYLWNFGNKMMGVGVLNTIYSNIVPVIIGKAGGAYDLGNLNRARSFAALPSTNLTGVIQAVTFPVLSKLQDDNDQLNVQYRRMIKVSSFVIFPIMLLLCAVAHQMVVVLVTDKWAGCVILLQIMCFTYMFQPVQILNLTILQVKGRTDLTFKLELFKKAVGLVVFIVAAQFGLIVVCVVDFFYTMFALLCNTYFTGKILNLSYTVQVRDIIPSFLLSFFIMAIVILEVQYISQNFLALVVGGLSGMVLYYGIAKILGFRELADIKYMLHIKL